MDLDLRKFGRGLAAGLEAAVGLEVVVASVVAGGLTAGKAAGCDAGPAASVGVQAGGADVTVLEAAGVTVGVHSAGAAVHIRHSGSSSPSSNPILRERLEEILQHKLGLNLMNNYHITKLGHGKRRSRGVFCLGSQGQRYYGPIRGLF